MTIQVCSAPAKQSCRNTCNGDEMFLYAPHWNIAESMQNLISGIKVLVDVKFHEKVTS